MEPTFWTDLADNTTLIALLTGFKFALIVAVATAVASVVVIFSIEWAETSVRRFKAWLHKRPNGSHA